MRNQILTTQKMINVPTVKEGFAVIAGRLQEALPEPCNRFEVIVLHCDQRSTPSRFLEVRLSSI
jgi:hypothetical protein